MKDTSGNIIFTKSMSSEELGTMIETLSDENIVDAISVDWKDQAECRTENGANVDMFPPEKPKNNPEILKAKKVCGRCVVSMECLLAAVTRSEPGGVWGGKTPYERKPLITSYRARFKS